MFVYILTAYGYLKDDIEFVTEFPCLLGHPASAKQYD